MFGLDLCICLYRVHLYYSRRKIIIYTLLRYTCAVNIVFIKVQYVQQNLIINIHYRRRNRLLCAINVCKMNVVNYYSYI